MTASLGRAPYYLLCGNSLTGAGVVVLVTKAIQFDQYGDIDVLEVRDVARAIPVDGKLVLSMP
jgi:hypothetical protein